MGDRSGRAEEWVIEMEEKLSRTEPLPTKDEEDVPQRNQREKLLEFYASNNRFEEELWPARVNMTTEYQKEMKEASLLHFLRRSVIKNPLQSYLKALSEVSDELKEAWEGLGYRYGWEFTQQFVQMMLLNGAFILEFMRTKREYSRQQSPDAAASVNPVIRRILEDHDETKRYLKDFLLMGNQLPIMLLHRLLMVEEGTIDKDRRVEFLKDIVATFVPVSRVPRIEHMYNEFKSSLHILDVHRRSLVHRDFKRGKAPKRRKSLPEFYSMNIPSATELHKVGIGFTISSSTSMLDVSLQGKTLMLPEIVVDDSTLPSFSNLITFEQLHKDVAKNEIASYMYFMGCLVLVASDASLLQSCGIIITTWPPDRVADFFNEMTRQYCNVPSDSLAPEIIEAFTMVKARYNKMATEWRKDLFQTYLRSPWAIMSVVAAILLFTLSFIQTIYAVLGYVHPK